MSEEKCFCHLGEYAVKDATARKDIEELKGKVTDLKRNDVHPMYWRVLVTVEDDPVANETEIELSDVDTTVDLTSGTPFCALVNATTSKKLFRCYFSKGEYVDETHFKALVTSVTEIEVGSSGSSGDTLTTVEHVRVGNTEPLGTELIFPPERFNRTPVKGDTFGLAYVDTTNMKLYNCILTVGDLDPDYNVDMYVCTITTAVIIWNIPQASAGTTLNKYTYYGENIKPTNKRFLNIVKEAKGRVLITVNASSNDLGVFNISPYFMHDGTVHFEGTETNTKYNTYMASHIYSWTTSADWKVYSYNAGTNEWISTNATATDMFVTYWNDTEITA